MLHDGFVISIPYLMGISHDPKGKHYSYLGYNEY